MTDKKQTTLIAYWATEQQDKQIDSVVKHKGNWFNPEEDYYVMEDPSESTLMLLALLGVEIEFIKGAKKWHEYVKMIIENQEKAARCRRKEGV